MYCNQSAYTFKNFQGPFEGQKVERPWLSGLYKPYATEMGVYLKPQF